MIFKCVGGPMDGAEYILSRDRDLPSTNRKPDGLWFNGQDEHGRWVQHQYKEAGLDDPPEEDHGVVLQFIYDGPVVETGIEMETEENPADHYPCAVCKTVKHVDQMLSPADRTEDLVCDQGCADSWHERTRP